VLAVRADGLDLAPDERRRPEHLQRLDVFVEIHRLAQRVKLRHLFDEFAVAHRIERVLIAQLGDEQHQKIRLIEHRVVRGNRGRATII